MFGGEASYCRCTWARREADRRMVAAATNDGGVGRTGLTRSAVPRSSAVTSSSRPPRSRAITLPPVMMARSSIIALRQWPYSGGWTHEISSSAPACRAGSPPLRGDISSDMINSGRPASSAMRRNRIELPGLLDLEIGHQDVGPCRARPASSPDRSPCDGKGSRVRRTCPRSTSSIVSVVTPKSVVMTPWLPTR